MSNKESIMNIKTISGKEILNNFFRELDTLPEIDTKVADALKELYSDKKLSATNLRNKLLGLREEAIKEFDDEDK